ncbi:hypothetical protein E1B28_013076 [Marasmius oreades]|uniref:SH3 domain-containing protein n=1 Tax=Marasmius oreades TaxID=181124 RepID=A0A9P7UPI5_9AGAR|nr:uncharacterized protein E1B28_013076 [Marasmius oreades]KAG7087094.1 hypothetical protein E1B28_013076 [Marasmius oreades]
MTIATMSDSSSEGANSTEHTTQQSQNASKSSLSLEITNPPSSSPFPSPSSSFLPPPTMQKNEFALPARFPSKSTKKVGDPQSQQSQHQNGMADAVNGSEEPTKTNGVDARASSSSSLETSIAPKGPSTSSIPSQIVTSIPALTPTTPTPDSVFHKHKTSSSSSSSPTTPLPHTPHRLSQPVIPIPSPPSSPRFCGSLHPSSKTNRDSTASFTSTGSSGIGLTSSRPAPPSPAMSRRTSAVLSRAGSTRRTSGMSGGDKRGSLLGFTSTEGGRTTTPVPKDAQPAGATSAIVTSASTSPDTGMSYRTPIQIRDYAYPDADSRRLGLGADGQSLNVPKPNRIRFLNKRLLGELGWRAWRKDEKKKKREKEGARDSVGSVGSSRCSEDEWEERAGDPESEGEDDGNNGWGSFKFGLGRFSYGFPGGGGGGSRDTTETINTTSSSGFPTQTELDRNFNFPDSSESSDDTEGEDEEGKYYSANASPAPEGEDGFGYADEDDLYPGLYKALYAFEPEGTAEMALQEDQLVRVVGRGGGVGWAVVVVDGVDEKGDYVEFDDTDNDGEGKKRHALVPESYLEAVRLDSEEDG